MRRVFFILFAISSIHAGTAASWIGQPFKDWTLSEAIAVLNSSSWARQETLFQVVGGIGSGIEGEKEIYNTFFIRFLSAGPIREALARIQQIQMGYDELSRSDQQRLDLDIEHRLNIDVTNWIVVAVAFRSNNPRQESRVERYFETQTTETMRMNTYLSTDRFPKVELHAYFPPLEQSVGAKFVFPRLIEGEPIVTEEDETIVFELEAPGANPLLRATFPVEAMIVGDELVL